MFSRINILSKCRKTLSDSLETPSQSPIVQLVRWRKRRWVPRAPSKMYYVRQPTPEDPEEKAFLFKANAIYKTACKSIKMHLKKELREQTAARASQVALQLQSEEYARVVEENDRWNRETALIRQARQDKEEAEAEETRINKILALEEEKERIRQEAVARVKLEKERSKHFITLENLEEEIEKALNTRVNYNFAIDLEGNRYVELPDGSTKMTSREEAELVQQYHEYSSAHSEPKETVAQS